MTNGTYTAARLTPERVESASFPAARLGRRGVDETQVREFCGWVSVELTRMLGEQAALEQEVRRLRARVLGNSSGHVPDDGHVQAVQILSKAQQTADRYVASAQEYSRDIAEDARRRRDQIVTEAQSRAKVILDQAHASATTAAAEHRATDVQEPLSPQERRDLEAEIAYLRTYSDVCRTHLRAYLESLARGIQEWEQAENEAAKKMNAGRPLNAVGPVHVG